MGTDIFQTVTEVIDLRSFSNLWFWIALAVLWSTASHWVIGVPNDMIARAKRGQEAALADVELLAGVYGRRLIYTYETAGIWLTGFTTFALTGLGIAGLIYGIEICQALFLMAVPMSIVGAQSIQTAYETQGLTGDALLTKMGWHRLIVQVIGAISIFVTAMFGMWTNLNVNVLGG